MQDYYQYLPQDVQNYYYESFTLIFRDAICDETEYHSSGVMVYTLSLTLHVLLQNHTFSHLDQ